MIKRLKTSVGALAGLSALALGGGAIAGAATTHTTAAVERGNHTAADRVDAGSRNERAKAGDRDRGQKAERSTKDRHGDR